MHDSIGLHFKNFVFPLPMVSFSFFLVPFSFLLFSFFFFFFLFFGGCLFLKLSAKEKRKIDTWEKPRSDYQVRNES